MITGHRLLLIFLHPLSS